MTVGHAHRWGTQSLRASPPEPAPSIMRQRWRTGRVLLPIALPAMLAVSRRRGREIPDVLMPRALPGGRLAALGASP